jgi:hypothetical protein
LLGGRFHVTGTHADALFQGCIVCGNCHFNLCGLFGGFPKDEQGDAPEQRASTPKRNGIGAEEG